MILFYFFGLSIAVFLLLLTLVKRNKTNADYILAAWMAYMAIHLTFFVLDYSRFSYQHPHLLGVLLPFPILHGLFLYLYTNAAITNRFPGNKNMILHLIPFLLLTVLAIPFYTLSAQEKLKVYLNQGLGYEWYSTIQISLFVIVGLSYSFAGIRKIKRHRKEMLNIVSNTGNKTLIWLEWMSYGLACIWLVAFFFNDRIIFSGVVLFILFIGVFGINQTPVFHTRSPEQEADPPGPDETITTQQGPEKYQKSRLTEEDAMRLLNTLESFMNHNKPYKNPELTLDELAATLKVHPNQLSQVINSRIGKTFYHYVNSYRIKEFLTLAALPGSNKFTYLGLASDCGFQSKTTFNKYFKLETGKTPSEYFQMASAA